MSRAVGRAIALLAVSGLLWVGMAQAESSETSAAGDEVGARDVRVGLYLGDLAEVDGSKQSFLADVMLIASWTDPKQASENGSPRTVPTSQIWHPELLVVNQRSVRPSLPEVVTVRPDGSAQYLQRFTGTFSADLDLRAFPRDRQRLAVWVVAPLRMGEPVRLLVDDSLAHLRNDRLSIGDWTVGEVALSPRPFLPTAEARPAPGVELSIEVERRVTYYIVQVLIPLIAILLMAWTVFWIEPATTNVRVSVAVTTMLTLIAYRFALGSHVPRLSYLTLLDWFLLGATVLVMLTLGTMAYTAFLLRRGREARIERIDRLGRLLYPCVVLLFALLMWVR